MVDSTKEYSSIKMNSKTTQPKFFGLKITTTELQEYQSMLHNYLNMDTIQKWLLGDLIRNLFYSPISMCHVRATS